MSDLLDDILPPYDINLVDTSGVREIVRLVPGKQEAMIDEHGSFVIGVQTLVGILQNARPSPNGAHGYEAICHGCGAKIRVKRRPLPGKRNWCPECKASGEPAAQRARDYRSRKEMKT